MGIKKPTFIEYHLEATTPRNLLCVSHADDCREDWIELCVMQKKQHIAMENVTATARIVTKKDKLLLSDNVPCTVNEAGNILIPYDTAVLPRINGDLLIEVTVAHGDDVLTLPFPLWVRVKGSVLDDAQETPASQGAVADLLRAAQQELADVEETISALQDTIQSGLVLTDADKQAIAQYAATLVDISGKADKATTLSGYGITNAYTRVDINNLLSGKANASHTHAQYLTAHQDISGKANTADVPTKTSDLQNDSGFLTQHQTITPSTVPMVVTYADNTIETLNIVTGLAVSG